MQESNFSEGNEDLDAELRTLVVRVPIADLPCAECGTTTVIPPARYEVHGPATYAFELEATPMTMEDLQRRRILLENQEDDWHPARVVRLVGRRLRVLEDLKPRKLSTAEKRECWSRTLPEGDDNVHDLLAISQTVEAIPWLADAPETISETLASLPETGLATLRESPLPPDWGDTYGGSGLIGARRLARRRIGLAEGMLGALGEALAAKRVSAMFAVARSVVEISALAMWLLQPADLRLVAARYYADRWSGLRAAVLLRPSMKVELQSIAREEAKGLAAEGYDVGWDKQEWPTTLEKQGKANALSAVEACFPDRELGEEAYRALSALAHGEEYGLDDFTVAQDAMVVTLEQQYIILRMAVWPYGVALHRLGETMGSSPAPALAQVNAVLESVRVMLERLQAKDESASSVDSTALHPSPAHGDSAGPRPARPVHGRKNRRRKGRRHKE
ncbi:hypothetical protein [Vallicoccus soli]|uniref:hypothetical protein n=1 Tax=Vallicoccus soli TaxID=2339232 RepID=UPI00105A3AB7|nr:hypothetical protein [Vallicoccus soli]